MSGSEERVRALTWEAFREARNPLFHRGCDSPVIVLESANSSCTRAGRDCSRKEIGILCNKVAQPGCVLKIVFLKKKALYKVCTPESTRFS
jgi:hypothetical protein